MTAKRIGAAMLENSGMRRDDTSGGVDLNDATKMSAADDDTS
jgi:hypothetical protein